MVSANVAHKSVNGEQIADAVISAHLISEIQHCSSIEFMYTAQLKRVKAGIYRSGWPTSLTACMMALAGCSTTRTSDLAKYDITAGYRFEKLRADTVMSPRNSENLFVMLAFSGGGTRAAAMSYGVLAQLRAAKIHINPTTGEPEKCAPLDSPACKATERSLLDEVDVISSVSGGSFTSAYYTLFGDEIFNADSNFHRRFLYHRVQSDLAKQAVYSLKSWPHLLERTEIAAKYYNDNIFKNANFGNLEHSSRPYLILNATDASTGARFEFTQQQFDLLCADLSKTPVARGVTASSAFPVLLNSIRMDSFNAKKDNCGYVPSLWEKNGLSDFAVNPVRYRRAKDAAAYRDTSRKHLHLLDGGLADNLGLRAFIQSMISGDQQTKRVSNDSILYGGWSLMQRLTRKPIKRVIVITVDARTNNPKNWDTKTSGPGLVSVVDASAGIPMGNFTSETLEMMRQIVRDTTTGFNKIKFYAASVGIDNVALPDERKFLNAAGTNFELPEFTVNCLMSRSAQTLRGADVVAGGNDILNFDTLVTKVLKGDISAAAVPTPQACTEAAAKKMIKTSSHTVDVLLSLNMTGRNGSDVDFRRGAGLSLRVAKPNGIGFTAGVTWPEVVVPAVRDDSTKYTLGRARLYGVLGGVVFGHQFGREELNVGLSAGYALGNFRTSASTRAMYARDGISGAQIRSTGTYLVRPNISVLHSLTEKFALTATGTYLRANPTLKIHTPGATSSRALQINAFQFSAGVGYRLF